MVRKPDEVVKKPDERADRPPPLLAVIAQAEAVMANELHARLDAAGYGDQTLAQSRLFGCIPPDGIRLTALAERAQLTKQAAGELIDQMEAAGYVARSADPTDARAKLIRFTDRGWRAVDAALGIFDDLEAALADVVGAEQVATARQVLEAFPNLVRADDAS